MEPRRKMLFILGQALAMYAMVSIANAIGDVPGEPGSLPGWLGSVTVRPPQIEDIPVIDQGKIIQISSERPRAYLYRGFLSDKECDYLVSKGRPSLTRSLDIPDGETEAIVSQIRTSHGAWIDKGADRAVRAIEQRLAEWTFLPVANQEPTQVLRYREGEEYKSHADYFENPDGKEGGQRYATVIMYLNTVIKGGETVFSKVRDDLPKDRTWSNCSQGYLAVKPRKGDALLLFNMHPDGTVDEFSQHRSCPVEKGTKWVVAKWIRERSIDEPGSPPCEDITPRCAAWAKSGECTRNKGYMLGNDITAGACRKACGAC